MATGLTHHIQTISLVDTHEHLHSHQKWVDEGPDIAFFEIAGTRAAIHQQLEAS